jgi:hypothetical protein
MFVFFCLDVFRRSLSTAKWQNQYKMAEVTTIKGKHFRTMGTTYKSKLFLEVEEAL